MCEIAFLAWMAVSQGEAPLCSEQTGGWGSSLPTRHLFIYLSIATSVSFFVVEYCRIYYKW